MNSRSLNPSPIQIRIGILKHYCKSTGLTHNELLGKETLSEYLSKPFNRLLFYKFIGSYNNQKKMQINPLAI